jgi:hypothetical protein
VADSSSLPDAAAQHAEGPFMADSVPCDADLCTAGQLGGGLSATDSFTLDGTVGRSVITTRSGRLLGDDQVQLDWTSMTTANFTATVGIVGGTSSPPDPSTSTAARRSWGLPRHDRDRARQCRPVKISEYLTGT